MTTADECSLADLTKAYLTDVSTKRDPYAMLERLRETEPVHLSSAGTWIISEYALAKQALQDRRFSRREAAAGEVAAMFEPGEAACVYSSKMLSQEGEDHARLRRLMRNAFSPSAARGWRPFIEQVVDELFDEFADHGAADLASGLAYPVPERVVTRMLNVPTSDNELYEKWARVLNTRPNFFDGEQWDHRAAATAALSEFVEYIRDLVKDRRAQPLENDLVTELIAIEEEGERLSERELIAVIHEVINAGHDTTANMVVNGILTLLEHPVVFEQLRGDPSLVDSTVEELLRFRSPVQHSLLRVTTADVEIGGRLIPKDSTVTISLTGADRQASVFPNPDDVDIAREQNPHLAFGNGSHYCLGVHIARVELQVTFDRIARRLPGLRLAVPPEELPWRRTGLVVAPSALPCLWEVGT